MIPTFQAVYNQMLFDLTTTSSWKRLKKLNKSILKAVPIALNRDLLLLIVGLLLIIIMCKSEVLQHLLSKVVSLFESDDENDNMPLVPTDHNQNDKSTWYPNKRQIQEILSEQFNRCSDTAVLEKMNNNEAYDVRPDIHGDSGFCLIVNIKHYSNGNHVRHGSEYDVQCLKCLMEMQFHMHVDVLLDCTKQELIDKISYLVSSDQMKSFKCVVVFLMAHGDGDHIIMVDGQWVNYREAVEYKLGDSEVLAGKPKLIFIEACQGTKSDRGRVVGRQISHDGGRRIQISQITNSCRIPNRADIVAIRATHAPIRAARHKKFGTFFIQAICEVLKADAHKKKIEALCRKANDLMRSVEIFQNCQILNVVSNTLHKSFYFYCKFKSAIFIVGGSKMEVELVRRKDRGHEIKAEIEIASTLKSPVMFNCCEGFLHRDSIFGFVEFWMTKASLLQLHIPTMQITQVGQHPGASYEMSTCQLDQSNLFITTGGVRLIESAEAYLIDVEQLQNYKSYLKTLPSMTIRRSGHSVRNFKSRIVATGGETNKKTTKRNQEKTLQPFKWTEHQMCEYLVLDSAEERWISGPSLLQYRLKHASAVLDGRLFVAGGKKHLYTCYDSVEFLDDRMNKWQKAATMNQRRSSFSLTVFGGQLFASGGEGGNKTTESYERRMECWLPGPSMEGGRDHHVAVVVPEKLIGLKQPR